MEEIYDINTYRATKHIDLKNYFKEFHELGYKETSKKKLSYSEKILREMHIDDNEIDLKELKKRCSISLLGTDQERDCVPIDIPQKLTPKTEVLTTYIASEECENLYTVKCKKELEKIIKKSEKDDLRNIILSKYRLMIQCSNVPTPVKDIPPNKEILYTLTIYKPFSASVGQKYSTEKIRFSCEVEALGSNKLTDIAENILCVLNNGIYKEINHPDDDLTDLLNPRAIYPSQTIFIDGVFYNDMRSSSAIEYSTKLIEWAKEKNIGNFTTANMDETRLDSLKPRLGYPYVYIHQGECEHIFLFSDCRLLMEVDTLYTKAYPKVSRFTRQSNIMCYFCMENYTQWICCDGNRFPEDRIFLCTECCKAFNYKDGKKIGNFKLYPFFDNELVAQGRDDVII